jgi:DNA processing protein
LVNQFGGAEAAVEAPPALSRRGGRAQAIRLCAVSEAEAELETADHFGAHLLALGEHGTRRHWRRSIHRLRFCS